MGYKDENRKHALGISGKPKYKCPHCKTGLNIPKKMFVVVCSKCKKTITEDEY